MFEVPRHRIRAYIRTLRKLQSAQLSKQRAAFHLKRTTAQLSLTRGFARPSDIVQTRVILNDLTPSGIFVFTSQPLPFGLQVGVTIQVPEPFFALARVISCKTIPASGRVITETTYPYRVQLEFEFASDDEQEAVREYCRTLAREYLNTA